MALYENVTDRVAVYPGRVVLTPVAGLTNTYTMVRADQPSVAGTPLNATLFQSIATAINARVASITIAGSTLTFLAADGTTLGTATIPTYTLDASPTNGSGNPATSGGIYTALSKLYLGAASYTGATTAGTSITDASVCGAIYNRQPFTIEIDGTAVLFTCTEPAETNAVYSATDNNKSYFITFSNVTAYSCECDGLTYIALNNVPQIAYLDTAPVADNTDGGLKIVLLDSAPAQTYKGYIYIIDD